MNLINSYPYYISRLKELDVQYKNEVGGGATSQYGIDAAMPKAQKGNSDPVHNDTIGRMKMDKELNRLQEKVRYIQNCWERITDERTTLVFNLRLNGMTYQSIAKEVGISPQRAHSNMNEVCETLQD